MTTKAVVMWSPAVCGWRTSAYLASRCIWQKVGHHSKGPRAIFQKACGSLSPLDPSQTPEPRSRWNSSSFPERQIPCCQLPFTTFRMQLWWEGKFHIKISQQGNDGSAFTSHVNTVLTDNWRSFTLTKVSLQRQALLFVFLMVISP